MSRALPFSVIVDAALQGAENGIVKYHGMNTYGVADMPESYIQANIADELHRAGSPYVTMETKFSEIEECGGGKCDGRSGHRSGKRVDVVGWWASDKPRVLIEVKRFSTEDCCDEDHKRVRSLIRVIESVEKGILVVCSSSGRKKTIESQIESVSSSLSIDVYGGVPIVKKYANEEWWWGVGCFIVNKS